MKENTRTQLVGFLKGNKHVLLHFDYKNTINCRKKVKHKQRLKSNWSKRGEQRL